MTVEIEYSNPTPLTAGAWQVTMAETIVANASADTPVGSLPDIEREIRGGTLIIRLTNVPGTADLSANREQGITNTVQNHLSGATHVETREV